MGTTVSTRDVAPRIVAAVRRRVRIPEVSAAWRPALDEVWAFLRTQPGLRTDGHNVFVYRHPARRDEPMDVDFGVEVVREFAPAGQVQPTRTPAGTAAVATHVGPYSRLGETHDAIHAWADANGRAFAGTSWEVYGDWSDDPAKLETTIFYALR